ncbi:hypothetical protein AAG906_029369 [Vitis piasezkii]
MLSFLDAFSGYHQILMRQPDEEKIIFITPHRLYSYRVMPFGLKNVGATYQRLMTKIFKPLIRCISRTRNELAQHLDEIFHLMRGYNMKLNPTKCVFGVNTSKFLGFIVTQRGIEVNPNQIKVVMETSVPSCNKELQRLIGCLAALGRFIARFTDKLRPFSPQPDEQLYMYLAVFDYVVSAVLFRCMKDKEQRSIYYVMADFIAETPSKFQQSVGSLKKGWWILHIDRASQIQGEYEAKDERMARHLSKEAILLLVYLQAASSIATTPVCNTSEIGVGWMHEIKMYLWTGDLLEESKQAYKGGPLQAVVWGSIPQGYYWSTMRQDAKNYVKRCDRCQRYAPIPCMPSKALNLLAPARHCCSEKFLLVATDYFSKWVEAEAYANIKDKDVSKFVWKNIICRFRIPQAIVADNGPQFDNIAFKTFCLEIKIKNLYSTSCYPQSNG